MKPITIRGLDGPLADKIEELACAKGLSLNKTIHLLLKRALGMSRKPDHRKDFAEFCGGWSVGEAQEFSSAISDLAEVDPRDWEK